MYTVDDLVDAIMEQLAPLYSSSNVQTGPKPAHGFKPGNANGAPSAAGKRRIFLSEWDVKKALTPGGKELTIGRDVIVSPLALEWIELRGIRIIRV